MDGAFVYGRESAAMVAAYRRGVSIAAGSATATRLWMGGV